MIYIVISEYALGARHQLDLGDGRVSFDLATALLRSRWRVSGGFAAFWR
jgi:hypothetical protein